MIWGMSVGVCLIWKLGTEIRKHVLWNRSLCKKSIKVVLTEGYKTDYDGTNTTFPNTSLFSISL
jgi:hypothetical protein